MPSHNIRAGFRAGNPSAGVGARAIMFRFYCDAAFMN